ncbi:sigma-70 family RNA polymerase sigma factor [Sporolactobacillus shoreicorticis]|nr:sigma-70 family RNA polymerase sigma factor [Sporolactobacillus shoreicorticis]MCO7125412.1 sigma-70 family RNA polymerase sigma factor [Sporolactobacillus shoreicorticis]
MFSHPLSAAKKREEQFTKLLTSCHSELYRTAWRYLKNEQDALDALQEVVCRTYTHFHKIKKTNYARTWMIRIMINYCLDELRRRKRFIPVDSIPDQTGDVRDPAASLDFEILVHQLSVNDQIIIILKYNHQYTLSEIAEGLDLPLGTVKTRLNHGLTQLRRYLAGEEKRNAHIRK